MKRHNRSIDHYQDMMDEFARIKFTKNGRNQAMDQGFKCLHCYRQVPVDPFFSHVQNRNHCPYCLWSRHLDLYQAGDRLCACKGVMRPVALTLKERHKKYVREGSGELMLVHQCQDCGRLSINRVAADDRTDLIWDVFDASCHLPAELTEHLKRESIRILLHEDTALVHARLSGVSLSDLKLGNHSLENAMTV